MTSRDPSSARTLLRSPALRWTLIWGAVCAIFVTQNASRFLMRGEPVDWFQSLVIEALYWAPWVALTPVLLAAARRLPLGGVTNRRHLVRHLGVMTAVGVVQVAAAIALQLAAMALFRMPRDGMARASHSDVVAAPALLIIAWWKYWVFIGIHAAFASVRRLRDQEVRAAQLEGQLATAQLLALKAQLHPHFLFNTLHSVSMLNFVDADAANRVLVQLSDLLRLALDRSGALEVSLDSEIDFLDQYLAIEQVRFGDRLRVQVQIDDRVAGRAVPNLILQPLVENAVRHGIAPSSSAGQLVIRAYPARECASALVLEVEDDGPGLPTGWSLTSCAGVGLANVRDRLRAAYAGHASLELLVGARNGVLARVTIPAAT